MQIKLRIHPRCKLVMKIQPARLIGVDSKVYAGDYQVVPDVYAITVLETKDRLLSENIEILTIPQYAVSNDAGGETLIIGKECVICGD